MHISKYQYFICPNCESSLELRPKHLDSDGVVISGYLGCKKCNSEYPIINRIPRFVESRNYSSSFGLQWKLHARTQIDKFNGTNISRERFYRETGLKDSDLKGKVILESGSGAGRFTQVILDAGATCFSFDYSEAVDANLENNFPHDNFILAQADIYQIPFKKKMFDYIICFGVLQHTPDVKRAFLSMVPYLKGGGQIIVDVYTKSFKALFHPKYALRLITTKLDKEALYKIIKNTAPYLLLTSNILRKLPLLGRYLSRLIPIANYKDILDIPEDTLLEWAILDTFDWLSPTYDQPQTMHSLKEFFLNAGLVDIDISYRGVLVGRGRVSVNLSVAN